MDEPNNAQPDATAEPEAPEAEASETPNPLFAEEGAGDDEPSAFDPPDESAEDEATAEGEEAPEKAELAPGLKRRMSQLARQKREARREADKARNEAAEARTRAEAATQFETAVREHYGAFKDPVRAMTEDAHFMGVLEKHKAAPEVQAILRFVQAKGGMMSENQKPEPAAPAAPAIPGPVAALLRETATTKIEAVLAKVGVKDGYRAILRDAVLEAGGDAAASMDEATILGHAKSVVTKYGLTESQVIEKPQASASKRPPTGGTTRPATTTATRTPAKESAKTEKPKSMRQWEEGHAARRAAFFGGGS